MDKAIKIILFFIISVAAIVALSNYYLGDFISPQGGIYLSADKGNSWYRFGQGAPGNLSRLDVTKIKYNPKDPRIMYLATSGSGVFKSVDSGNNWTQLTDTNKVFSPRAVVYDVGIDYTRPDYAKKTPDRFYLAVSQDGLGRIFKTEDGGVSFKEVYTTQARYAVFTIQTDPVRPNIIWAGTGDGLLLKSQDYGETWKIAQEFGAVINSVIIDPRNPSHIFVATYQGGIFTSDDNGVTWIDESEALANYSNARAIRIAERDPHTGDIYLGTWFGLLKSTNGGIDWIPLDVAFPNDALPVSDIAFGVKNSKEIYVSAKNYIYSTVDGGAFWKIRRLSASKSVLSLIINPQDPSRIFAGLGSFVNR